MPTDSRHESHPRHPKRSPPDDRRCSRPPRSRPSHRRRRHACSSPGSWRSRRPSLRTPAAAVTPPDGSETFQVSQSDDGRVDRAVPDRRTASASSSPRRPTISSPATATASPTSSPRSPNQGSDDPFTGAPTLVSVPDGRSDAVRANAASGEPVASADGRYVAFTSAATNLVAAGGTAGRTSIYVRDTLLGQDVPRPGRRRRAGRRLLRPRPQRRRPPPRLHVGGDQPLAPATRTARPTHSSRISTRTATASSAISRSSRFLGDVKSSQAARSEARISGNGSAVVFTAHQDRLSSGVAADDGRPATSSSTRRCERDAASAQPRSANRAPRHASTRPATRFAFIADDALRRRAGRRRGARSTRATTTSPLGTILTDRRVGYDRRSR